MSKNKKPTGQTVNKDAKTGKFVSDEYVDKHPATTYKQTIQPKPGKPTKK
jgi:hypothetical protein